MMVFKPLNNAIKVAEQEFKAYMRKGFTVI